MPDLPRTRCVVALLLLAGGGAALRAPAMGGRATPSVRTPALVPRVAVSPAALIRTAQTTALSAPKAASPRGAAPRAALLGPGWLSLLPPVVTLLASVALKQARPPTQQRPRPSRERPPCIRFRFGVCCRFQPSLQRPAWVEREAEPCTEPPTGDPRHAPWHLERLPPPQRWQPFARTPSHVRPLLCGRLCID